jgi:hypothetical protein
MQNTIKATRNATLFSASFRGIFGRNRSEKFTTERNGGVEAPEGIDTSEARNKWLYDFAHAFAREINAKAGILRVTRYDNCEIYIDDPAVQVIPITQGVTILSEVFVK